MNVNNLNDGTPIPVVLIDYATEKIVKTFDSIKDCAIFLYRNPQKAKHLYKAVERIGTKIRPKKYHPNKIFTIKKVKK